MLRGGGGCDPQPQTLLSFQHSALSSTFSVQIVQFTFFWVGSTFPTPLLLLHAASGENDERAYFPVCFQQMAINYAPKELRHSFSSSQHPENVVLIAI